VIEVIHYTSGDQATVPKCVIVCAKLPISMQSDGPLDEVLINNAALGKIISRGRTVG
jgi:hypothetical protein